MITIEQFDHEAILASAEHPYWVVDDAELKDLCEHWRQCALVAIDTEFMRTDTYYPIPGLIQLADNTRCYLIDPLHIDDWEPFRALLRDSAVMKVLHAPGEDLDLFKHSYGVIPAPLFDTQMAASFLGLGQSVGLQRLLKEMLDAELTKDETRSDWLQRPLTPEQERYAALDVAYLPRMAQIQLDQLNSLGRMGWLEEETAKVLDGVADETPGMRNYYLRFSQLSGLGSVYQAALRDLAYWRELKVRELDQPRNRLLSNKQIIDIIQKKVNSLKQLSELNGIPGRLVGKFGEEIIELIQQRKVSAERNPPVMIPKPLSGRWHKPAKALMAEVAEIAERLQMPAELLARKRDVEALIRSLIHTEAELPQVFSGWRNEVVAQPLIAKFYEITGKHP